MLPPAGRLQMSHGPKLQHHFYSTKGMWPTTEVTEAAMLHLKLQGLRLVLPGFEFRQICEAQHNNATILKRVGWIFLKLSKSVWKGATGFKEHVLACLRVLFKQNLKLFCNIWFLSNVNSYNSYEIELFHLQQYWFMFSLHQKTEGNLVKLAHQISHQNISRFSLPID